MNNTMTDKFNHIHQSSNDQLAEKLDEIVEGAVKAAKDNRLPDSIVETMNEEVAILKEASRRLRIKPPVPFNDEAFSTK